MSLVKSLVNNAHIVVIGAGGGIGAAVTATLSEDPRVALIDALSRTGQRNIAGTAVRAGEIDILDECSIEAAASCSGAAGPVDMVFVATGILHEVDGMQPEKRMRDFNVAQMSQVMLTNAVGPALVAKHFLPLLRRDAKTVFAAISARVGSISDNRLGGWASYRASKAALNMIIKTVAIEQARSRPETVVVSLHPGTVDTGLSRPFQGRVPRDRLFTPAHSADRLLRVVDRLRSADTGGFFAWDGTAINY